MVRRILLVVEVDEEGRALDPEGVRLRRVGWAEPGEVEFFLSAGQLTEQVAPDRLREVLVVGMDQPRDGLALFRFELRRGDALGHATGGWAEFGVVVTSGTSGLTMASLRCSSLSESRSVFAGPSMSARLRSPSAARLDLGGVGAEHERRG